MKNIKYIIVGVVLISLTYLITQQYFSSNKSTIKSTFSEFGTSDTGSISKVFLADMKGNQVVLEKKGPNNWMVNNKYQVVQHNIDVMLETMNLMTVKSPVAKARYDKTIRDLSSMGTKVEIYQGGSTPSKVIYIGTTNQNHTGNYMMIEGANLPYLVHIEGFKGFLSPRFSTLVEDWRKKTIFHSNPRDIAEIHLSFPKNKTDGFMIKQTEGEIALYNHAGVPVEGWDTGYIYDYLDRFRDINFEMWEQTKTPMFIDSVSTSTPLEIYEIVTQDGQRINVKTLLKPLKSGMDIDGNPIDHDQDRMYALINDKEFVIIQYFVFDPLNHHISYFYAK